MTSDTGDQPKNTDRPTVKFRRQPIRTQRVSPGLLILATVLLIAIILLLRWVSERG
jgi:hypothetical protein